MLDEMNPNLDVTFWVPMNQKIKLNSFFIFAALNIFHLFCPKGTAASPGSEISVPYKSYTFS